MSRTLTLLMWLVVVPFCIADETGSDVEDTKYIEKRIVGWSVQIQPELLISQRDATATALKLLETQLDEITRVVPDEAVAKLQSVPLYFSPQYPDTVPRAEYHPDAKWLREHHRNPIMEHGIEFTNIRIFPAETRRMPNFALHELAHAYHHLVLEGGFGNQEIRQAYERAKQSGIYDDVERRDSEGKTRRERAYAMTTPQEYFAETTEAYFSRNDFFPYDRSELLSHDPEMAKLLAELWH